MVTKRLILHDTEEAINLFGQFDSNIRQIERDYKVQIFIRHADGSGGQWPTISIRGSTGNVEKALNKLEDVRNNVKTSNNSNQNNQNMIRQNEVPSKYSDKIVYTTSFGKNVYPRSENQEKYVELMKTTDMVIAIGPAGTGKTYLAVAQALADLKKGRVSKIVLTRPVVEAGEKLGFLPGDFYEKVNPYLRPLYDAFYSMLGSERFRLLRDEETIEIVPIAFMRGRTMDNSFIILDEAQNTLPEQMKMFLTRMGNNAKVIITGDITQIDLEDKARSGLVLAPKILKDIKEIKFIYFNQKDVVRHNLVKKIILAYEDWENNNK